MSTDTNHMNWNPMNMTIPAMMGNPMTTAIKFMS